MLLGARSGANDLWENPKASQAKFLSSHIDTGQEYLRLGRRYTGWHPPTAKGLLKYSAACYHYGSVPFAVSL